MDDQKNELNEKELEQVSGGLEWGPFDDCVVSCPSCGERQIIYKSGYPWHCQECDALMMF